MRPLVEDWIAMLSLTDGMQLVMKEQYLRLVAPRRMASDAVIETRNAAKE